MMKSYCIATFLTVFFAVVMGAKMPRGNCTSTLWPTPFIHIECPPGRMIRIDGVTKVTLRSQTGCFFGPMSCIDTEKQLREICHWRQSCEWSSGDMSSACPVRANYACIVGTTFAEIPLEESEESSGVEAPEVKTHAPTTTSSRKPHSEVPIFDDIENEIGSDEDDGDDKGSVETNPVPGKGVIGSPPKDASSGNAYVILGLVLLALVILLVPLIIIVSRLRKKRQAAADYQAIGADEKAADNAAVENGENTDKTEMDEEKKPLEPEDGDADSIEKAKLSEENETEVKGEDDAAEDTKPITGDDSEK